MSVGVKLYQNKGKPAPVRANNYNVLSVTSKLFFQQANFAGSYRSEFLSDFGSGHGVGKP